MSIAEYVGRELSRELDKRSQEFYEFVMPAIDMYEEIWLLKLICQVLERRISTLEL